VKGARAGASSKKVTDGERPLPMEVERVLIAPDASVTLT